jgi:hypothetical protein
MNTIYSKIKITREGTFNSMDTIEKNRKNSKRKSRKTSKIFMDTFCKYEGRSLLCLYDNNFYKKGDEKSSFLMYINCDKLNKKERS